MTLNDTRSSNQSFVRYEPALAGYVGDSRCGGFLGEFSPSWFLHYTMVHSHS